jgi:membrane associated rhomboid family serine protease
MPAACRDGVRRCPGYPEEAAGVLLPYQVDVPMKRLPITNVLVVALALAAYPVAHNLSEARLGSLVLNGWRVSGLFGYMWLHANPIHIFGNMLFLWVFGNAVCAKVGNLAYIPVYIGLGLLAAVVHVRMDGATAVGASGAVNGVVGMFLVFYPLNTMSCFYLLLFRFGTIAVPSIALILCWFAFDVIGALTSVAPVAYFAHVGGFLGGMIPAVVLLKTRIVTMDRYERSLLQMFHRRH